MSYMDFLGETIAESYRTGKAKAPNRNNKQTKARSSFKMKMEQEAESRGKDVDEVALGYVEQNSGQLQKYIISKGEVPQDENPVLLAVQAYELRSQEVNDIAQAMGCDYATAEIYLDEAENNAMEMNNPEADSFLGEIVDALGRVAGKGLKKAADKRVEKGKKPGVAGFFANLLSPGETDTTVNLKDELSKVYSDIKANETKSAVKQYLPYIIIGLVLIILLTVFMTKKAGK